MIDKDLKTIADHFGYDNQKSKTIEEAEEFLEALEELSENDLNTQDHLAEEIADLEICLEKIKYLLANYEYVEIIKQQKIKRTLKRIESGYYEK